MAGVGLIGPVLLGLVVWWPWWPFRPCGVRRGLHESIHTRFCVKGCLLDYVDKMCMGVVLTCVGSVRLGLSLLSYVLSVG